MPNREGSGAFTILYAADLDDLRRWVGANDPARLKEAWRVVRETEDADWEPQELEVLERLLQRVVMEGRLYEGLKDEERYYLTQLLLDLFDEYGDPDALSEDIPLDRLAQAVELLPRESEAARLAGYLVRGRELGGDGCIWERGPVEDVLSYFGYVTREEAPRLAAGLEEALKGNRTPAARALREVQSAAEECARAELDLVSFVG